MPGSDYVTGQRAPVCCWGLMIVQVAVGVMNVAVMAALAVVIFVEKLWYRTLFGQTVRVLLVAIGVLAIWLRGCFLACTLRHAGDVRQGSHFRASSNSRQACSQRRQACSQTRQCS